VPGTAALGDLAGIYGLQVAAEHADLPLADFMAENLGRPARNGDVVTLGPIALLAHKVEEGRVSTVGLRLPQPEEPKEWRSRLKDLRQRARKLLG
jgi:cell volume regulation protein A